MSVRSSSTCAYPTCVQQGRGCDTPLSTRKHCVEATLIGCSTAAALRCNHTMQKPWISIALLVLVVTRTACITIQRVPPGTASMAVILVFRNASTQTPALLGHFLAAIIRDPHPLLLPLSLRPPSLSLCLRPSSPSSRSSSSS